MTKRLNSGLWAASQKDIPRLLQTGIDVFDSMHFAFPRLDKACDGSHFACYGRQSQIQGHPDIGVTAVGYWEALILTNVYEQFVKKIIGGEERGWRR